MITESTSKQQLAALLEDAMQALAVAEDVARESNRIRHADYIHVVLRQVEDLRMRNEDYDPDMGVDAFPVVFRSHVGMEPYAVRVAVAHDGNRAIYRYLANAGTFLAGRFAFVYPENEHGIRSPAHYANVKALHDPSEFAWDEEPQKAAVAS